MAGHALQTGLANDGLFYLLLVFLPLLGLPLLAPRWLLPVAPPLLLNLAAVQPEHHQLRFHYLATAAPLLAAGAVAGLAVVRSARRPLLAPLLVLLVVVAGFTSWRYGPAPWARDPVAVAAAAGRPGPARRAGPGGPGRARLGPVQPGPPSRPPGGGVRVPQPVPGGQLGRGRRRAPAGGPGAAPVRGRPARAAGRAGPGAAGPAPGRPGLGDASSTARAWSCCNAGRPCR